MDDITITERRACTRPNGNINEYTFRWAYEEGVVRLWLNAACNDAHKDIKILDAVVVQSMTDVTQNELYARFHPDLSDSPSKDGILLRTIRYAQEEYEIRQEFNGTIRGIFELGLLEAGWALSDQEFDRNAIP